MSLSKYSKRELIELFTRSMPGIFWMLFSSALLLLLGFGFEYIGLIELFTFFVIISSVIAGFAIFVILCVGFISLFTKSSD